MIGWIIPVSNRKKPEIRVCAACERRDPFMSRIEDRDAGVHAAHYQRWRREEIDACEHPDHAKAPA